MIILKTLKSQYFWLCLIILLGFWVRLYKIDSPIADWHSWRQADTASVTRNFIKEGFNPFLPKYDDMSAMSETLLTNHLRLRFVEFPIYNMFVYPLYLLFGVEETYHRLVSVLFSLGSIAFVFLIAKRYLGAAIGLLSALIFAVLPFNVFFSRTTLPEPTFLFFALGMVYFIDRMIYENTRRVYFVAMLFTVLAFLIKPWAIFFIPPLIYSIIKKEKKVKAIFKYVLFFVFTLSPFLLWRLWILQSPEGIPASSWLFNGDGIRFRPAFFWWIVQQRLGGEILGVSGLALFFIGLAIKLKNTNWFFHIWALSLAAYLIIVATGNVRHNYYQLILTPLLSIFLARGFVYLFKGNEDYIPRIWTIMLALFLLPLSFYFGFKSVSEFYKINNPPIIEAGKRADQILPKEAVVVAPYNGDSAFLYQINRSGWAVAVLPLKEMVADFGVTHYISVNKDDKTNWVKRHFDIVWEEDRFLIADLTRLKEKFDDTEDPEP